MKNTNIFSIIKPLTILTFSLSLIACGNGSWWSDNNEATLNVDQLKRIIPTRVKDRQSWAQDIFDISKQLGIPQTKQNMCTIIAVVDQESNFHADPEVAGLGAKAVKEVQERLHEKFTDKLGDTVGGTMAEYFQEVLKTQPTPENNYLSQMRRVKTERQLDELYREIFDYMSLMIFHYTRHHQTDHR